MKKITWKQLFQKMQPNWYFGRYNREKALLAFEFATVLSDVASQLHIEMTPELVLRAEKVFEAEMKDCSAEEFACKMNILILAVLEPKDVE